MGDAIRPATRAGVTFEVERLEHDGDELTVSGHWSGLRGVRFVRPTLMVGDHHVLATLEHKPWMPRTDRAWTAAFPWKGAIIDTNELALAVTPSITVPLCPPAEDAEPLLTLQRAAEDEPAAPPPETVVQAPKRRAATSAAEPRGSAPATPKRRAAGRSAAEPRASAPATPKRRAAGRSAEPRASAPATPKRAPAAGQDDRPQTAAVDRKRRQRLERELEVVVHERDALRLQLDDAQVLIAATEAHRSQLEAGLLCERRAAAAAVQERDEVARACMAAERSRDLALALCDEVLLTYRALVRHVHTARAEIDDAQSGRASSADDPLGSVVAEPQPPIPPTSLAGSMIDTWIVRVLGTVAAVCFIFLLISFTRILM
jgi:hypothetical protein